MEGKTVQKYLPLVKRKTELTSLLLDLIRDFQVIYVNSCCSFPSFLVSGYRNFVQHVDFDLINIVDCQTEMGM